MSTGPTEVKLLESGRALLLRAVGEMASADIADVERCINGIGSQMLKDASRAAEISSALFVTLQGASEVIIIVPNPDDGA